MAEYEGWSFDQVPESGGIPKSVIFIALFGVLSVFIIGGAVVANAQWNHVWPAAQSQRAPLGQGATGP